MSGDAAAADATERAERVRAYRSALEDRWIRCGASIQEMGIEAPDRPGFLEASVSEIPSWLLLPIWLHEAWAADPPGGAPDPALVDLLWGQWALFLYIRVQDDLLDGQLGDLRAQFLANRFLVESLEAFQRAPGLGAGFWDLYRTCLRDTGDGILEVHRREGEAGRFTAEDLDLHARVSSIFKAGVAAVCHRLDRDGEVEWLAGLQDQLAILAQVHDDLKDVESDLGAGRYTFVGNVLLAARPGEAIDLDERRRRLREGLLEPSRAEPIWQALRECVDRAEGRVPDSAPDPVHELLRSYRDVPEATEEFVHRVRVRRVFGELGA